MNYLAHARLSFGKPAILAGNMISDFIKGVAAVDQHLPEVQKGIRLHRLIDSFTDTHPATKAAKEIFRPTYRLYSGAFVDVVYDHFLAMDKNEFSHDELALFSIETYTSLETYNEYFPPKFKALFPYMKEQNWLFNYQYRWGIEKSMLGVVRRSQYLTESDTAFMLFEKNYSLFEGFYNTFWPEVNYFAQQQLVILENK